MYFQAATIPSSIANAIENVAKIHKPTIKNNIHFSPSSHEVYISTGFIMGKVIFITRYMK